MEVDVAAMLALALKTECSCMVAMTHYFWQVGVVPTSQLPFQGNNMICWLYSLWCCNCNLNSCKYINMVHTTYEQRFRFNEKNQVIYIFICNGKSSEVETTKLNIHSTDILSAINCSPLMFALQSLVFLILLRPVSLKKHFFKKKDKKK